jgi:hypothetical protein
VGDRPLIVLWSLFAWTLAALRLRLAAAHHEVFGVDATLAFLVAVVLPLFFVRTLLRPLRNALRRWRA